MTFDRYVGIDYSGARTAGESLDGLRIYVATPDRESFELFTSRSPRKYWTRIEIAQWLAQLLLEDKRALVAIDHGFSFPLAYFKQHQLALDWSGFLDDFESHWPTGEPNMYVDFVREGVYGNGAARSGNPRWRRLTEVRAGAKSVFHFDVPGSVAKSTHAGLPWLKYIRERAAHRVHFWPFDGWEPLAGHSVVVEAYPALWNKDFPREDRNSHQHDAYSLAEWMRRSDRDGSLAKLFHPHLPESERHTAEIEGWILGVSGLPRACRRIHARRRNRGAVHGSMGEE